MKSCHYLMEKIKLDILVNLVFTLHNQTLESACSCLFLRDAQRCHSTLLIHRHTKFRANRLKIKRTLTCCRGVFVK